MEEGYLKLWNQPDDSGVPSSERIIQYVTKVINEAWPTIYKACGTTCHHYHVQEMVKEMKYQQKQKTQWRRYRKIDHFGVLDDFIYPSVKDHEINHF